MFFKLLVARMIESIRNEACCSIEELKSSAQASLKKMAEEAATRFEDVTRQSEERMKQIKTTVKKNVKREITNASAEYSKMIETVEKGCVESLNDYFRVTRDKLLQIFENSKVALGRYATDVEECLSEAVKFVELVVTECVAIIREFANNAQTRLAYFTQDILSSKRKFSQLKE
ncbi:uncharacterized protein LOC132701892 isoform X2 [Cylas formicarius]|uniref:uncharacterized protein LOC132701892 isoform X2 n=1 Tax=Cylas formicarius TaxID=197179 RepID=UPI002958B636|nr:uncharacterized protein LOC132701892 isoform X2 [Cylas formicarius]